MTDEVQYDVETEKGSILNFVEGCLLPTLLHNTCVRILVCM